MNDVKKTRKPIWKPRKTVKKRVEPHKTVKKTHRTTLNHIKPSKHPLQKIHVRFLFFQKIRNLMRKLFKSMLTTLSELRERWLWSLRSKKDQNSGNPRKIFHFFKNSNSAFSAAKISALNSLWAPRTVQSKLILPRAHLRSKIDQKWTNPYNGEWSKNQWFYTKLQSKISPSSEGVERMDWTCWKLQFFSSKKFGVPIAYNKNQFPREYGYNTFIR